MGLPENEVAADNQRRRMEELSKSPDGSVVENVISVAGPAVAVGSALVASGVTSATGLAVAGAVVGGLGIVDWFRRLGSSKVNENLEALGQATEDALYRVENTLRKHGTSIDEIKTRIDSQGFKDGMASAALQALRTTQKNRLKRLALILANGVKEDKLEPESFDDMMRAAVELTDWDVFVLGKMYESQRHLLSNRNQSFGWSEQVGHIWTNWNRVFGLGEDQHLKLRPALSRLQALGLIAEAQTNFVKDGSLARQAFGLLPEGKEFYERLQEIAVHQ
jgi:DNA-binding transcriptional MerR regulator